MTAEIAIMNREAVALAADSAVTVTQGGAPKIFASANKLFALSRHHPIGIMVYGNASFMGVPWETVVKLYRAKLGRTAHATVQHYADGFVNFLQTEPLLAPVDSQELYVRQELTAYFENIARQIEQQVKSELQEENIDSGREFEQLSRDVRAVVVAAHYERWRTAEFAANMNPATASALRKEYRSTIKQTKERVFGSASTAKTSRQLSLLAGWILTKFDGQGTSIGGSGVVIAGFGEEQLFPSVRAAIVSGIAGGLLKYQHFAGKSADIGAQDGSAIIPFAQEEMVQSFMEGIDPEYRGVLLGAVNGILREYPGAIIDNVRGISEEERKRLKDDTAKASDKIFGEFFGKLASIGATRFVAPVTNTVANMPKSELPAVAEALVNLQSFKRRVSQEQETVGGPIDVMLISKGDGLVWIQRKHYFERELNPHYFQSALKEEHSATTIAGEGETGAQHGREG